MSITREEIKHIAELSRLELSEEEMTKFGGQLDSILKYISQLNEVDTKNIEPTAQVSGLSDIWRADDVHEWNQEEVEAALNQGEREGGQVKVKRVL
ncbi:MAG: Asp-tRNA(Asn)/Glu-tRNA(Gln) amidotransferase subunit GatC [Patescibacteria group bacterium]|jgi:aspartyl-tRNA(Asn)/glutamyl-tRNA(Gln) amidotransferase subunit C